MWNRIEDGWPEENTPVLVATKFGIAVCAWEWVAGKRWWSPTSVVGEYGYECLLMSHGKDSETAATHWMPLPPAPELPVEKKE